MLQRLYNLVFSLYLLRTNVYRHLCLACLSFYVKHFHNVPADPLGPSPRAKPSNSVERTRPQRVTTTQDRISASLLLGITNNDLSTQALPPLIAP